MPNLSDEKIAELTFEFYKLQREEMIHWREERLSFSLQLLLLVAGSVAAYFQLPDTREKFIIALIIVTLGFIGLLLNIQIEKTSRAHRDRARLARNSLDCLNDYVKANVQDFGVTHPCYYAINIITCIIGLSLMVAALV